MLTSIKSSNCSNSSSRNSSSSKAKVSTNELADVNEMMKICHLQEKEKGQKTGQGSAHAGAFSNMSEHADGERPRTRADPTVTPKERVSPRTVPDGALRVAI